MISFSFGLTQPEQPTIDESNPTASNELIENYNKQVDEYNAKVDEYNQQVDTNYNEAYAAYTEEKAKVEANNTFVDNVEDKVEVDSSESRGFENNSTSEIPTDWNDETNEANLKTIQIEKSDNPANKTIRVINIHMYLDENAASNIGYDDLEPTIYNSLEDATFELSDKLKQYAVLAEWETANIDYDDTVTLTSTAKQFSGNTFWLNGQLRKLGASAPSSYFVRSIDGYTQGYWTPYITMFASTATEVEYGWDAGETRNVHYAETTVSSPYLYNGEIMYEDIIVRTVDRQEPKNIFSLFTYIFKRLAQEPERQELPVEPIKEAYLSHLDKLELLKEQVKEPKESTPTPKKSTYGYGDPIEDIQVATTNPTTIIDTPTPKTESEKGRWALINLITTILACICALILLFVKKDTEDDEPTDEEKKDMRKMLATKIASIIIGIISIVIFIFTEDMSLPMVYTDKWTLLMILLLIIEIVNIFIIRQQSKGEKNDD